MKKIILAALVCALLVGGPVGLDYATAQLPSQRALDADSRNQGIDIWIHHKPFDWSTLVIDVREVSRQKAPIEVMRAFFQISEAMKDDHFQSVILASGGIEKFLLKGTYFQMLGREFGNENPVYMIRTFPENVYKPDGTHVFGTWTGGIFGVLAHQMQDVNDFNQQWYADVVH